MNETHDKMRDLPLADALEQELQSENTASGEVVSEIWNRLNLCRMFLEGHFNPGEHRQVDEILDLVRKTLTETPTFRYLSSDAGIRIEDIPDYIRDLQAQHHALS